MVISYIGEEAYDIILYTARTITKLNYRVLIVDLSESNAFKNAIYHGMELDSTKDIVNYRDINYVRRVPTNEELEIFKEGVIFIAYGYNYLCDTFHSSEINIVFNTCPHIIEKINSFVGKQPKGTKECIVNILIRDAVSIDDVDRTKKAVIFPFSDTKDNYIYHDMNDYETALNCQLKQVVNFNGLSAGMEKHITGHIHRLFPEINGYHIKKAFNIARKGK